LDEDDALARAENFHKKDWKDTFVCQGRKDIKARDLWDLIWKNSVESGDPGIYNIDLANRYTNVSYFESLDSTNPCGEISLPSYGNCCLGNVNLSNMVLDDGSDIDWKRLAKTVRTGVRFLDNVLTVNKFPTDTCKKVGERSRRIGLGVTGLHYMLIKLGIKYGSEKCLEFLDRLFTTIRDESYKQSIYLARDKSPFPEFNYKKYLNEEFAKTLPARIRMLVKRYGIRNAVMLTIPPCGTISMLHGISSGIEPIFSAMYKRRYRQNHIWKEQLVVDPLFQEYYDEGKSLEPFVGAYDVSPEDHIRVQATIQKYMDSCISKTINLPSTATPEEFSQAALDYAPYLKGLTVYRAGAKEGEPLQAIPLTDENIKKNMGEKKEFSVAAGDACSLAGGDC
jgi:ribonucleoside-diphosphate reductase alpha chain